MANVNGVDINLAPNKGMKEEAQRFLDWRRDGKDGGTQTAFRRARQILNNSELTPDVVVKMYAWKARHLVDRKAEGFKVGDKGYPSNGRVSHSAWGLPAGDKWVDSKYEAIQRARDPKRKLSIAKYGLF